MKKLPNRWGAECSRTLAAGSAIYRGWLATNYFRCPNASFARRELGFGEAAAVFATRAGSCGLTTLKRISVLHIQFPDLHDLNRDMSETTDRFRPASGSRSH
jgi:hypothetical protein